MFKRCVLMQMNRYQDDEIYEPEQQTELKKSKIAMA